MLPTVQIPVHCPQPPAGGQGSEPDRWAYDHGCSGYLLDDPTPEINDQGLPHYTVTLLSPRLGWTFFAPMGVLVIDAHTGQITRNALGDVPSWVDRVYSQKMAMTIANWYGDYSQADFQGPGSSNANRFRVSGEENLVLGLLSAIQETSPPGGAAVLQLLLAVSNLLWTICGE